MDLAEILKAVYFQKDENLLVGMDTYDDAGVYKITDDLALVQTADYVTPVVDDPYMFGQVAAANSLSDIYAMGGRPLTAINLCNFPAKGVEKKVLEAIIRGGYDKIQEAGATLVGGHTVKDDELKYGLSVTGLIHPDKIVRNSTAKPGDVLILTKPIGTGVLITGYKAGVVPEEVMSRVVAHMAALNDVACAAMLEVGVNACTDITGFGLGGHGLEMAVGSRVLMVIHLSAVPYYPESLSLMERGAKTGNTFANWELTRGKLQFEDGINPHEEMLFYDPQTSGGLLISVPGDRADRLLKMLRERGIEQAIIIGEVEELKEPEGAQMRVIRK